MAVNLASSEPVAAPLAPMAPPAPPVTPDSHGHGEGTASMPSATELEQTLLRLVRRVAMMLQAERCAFLLYDAEHDQLVARPPSLGLAPEQLRLLRLPSNAGIIGQAYR